ncbi:MAG: ATP-binding protein [Candidatus Falkowbacteria bacterium]
MFIFTYTAAILTIICFGFAAFILKQKKNLARYLGLIIIADAVWLGSNALADIASERFSLVLWSGLALISGSIFISLYLCFVELFINNKLTKLKFSVFFIPTLVVGLFAFSKYDVGEAFFSENTPAQFIPGVLYWFFLVFSFVGLVYGAIKLGLSYRHSDAKKRAQILYLEIGFFMLLIGGIVFSVLLPAVGILKFFNLGPQFSVFFIGFTSYAIIRHQLLDIKIVIQRGLIYSVLFSFVAVVYILGVLILGLIFQEITNLTMIIVGLLTTAAGIYGIPPLDRFFRRATDRFFFKDKYDYSEAIYELSDILNKNLNLSALLQKITDKLLDILRPESLYIIVPGQNLIFSHDKIVRKTKVGLSAELKRAIEIHPDTVLVISDLQQELDSLPKDETGERRRSLEQARSFGADYGIEMAIAIKSGTHLIGLVALGKKLSGDYYTSEDINLLKTFACQAAVAFENAQLYEKVKNHSKELEKKVVERTENIKSLQEEQRQMMMEIAHGLQTPLTIIRGELSLLNNQIKDKKEIGRLEHNIDHISRFIYDMLRLVRQERDGEERKTVFSLSELLEESIDNIKIITEDKNIDVAGNIEPDIDIFGDKSEVEELLMNLASNSLKFMKPGQRGKIILDLYRKRKEAVLIVADDGIGIDKKHISHIFEKMYRISNESFPDKKGTGLGLAICKKIVEKHGGAIRAESRLGKGTKFIIELPVRSS